MIYKKKAPLLIFLGPAFLFLAVFLYIPFVQNIFNSMYELSGYIVDGTEKFIGFANYRAMLTDSKLWVAVANSFKMMGLTLVFQVGLALILAIMVGEVKRGQQFFRTVYFFPIVISATAIGLMFNLFYSYNGGMFNQLLAKMGKEPVLWLSDSLAFIMITIPVLWQYVGYYFVIILAGLSGISEEVFEAADIDGASRWQKVIYITIPLLRNVVTTCAILAVTGALKVFDLPWVMAPYGAPRGITHFLGTYMYETTFINSNVDYGAAIALLIVLLGIISAQIMSRLFKQSDDF